MSPKAEKKSAPPKIAPDPVEAGSKPRIVSVLSQQPADSVQPAEDLNDQTADSHANPVYSPTLEEFVHQAWTHLEPVSPLVWNWHLDLICEYLTLIKNERVQKKMRRRARRHYLQRPAADHEESSDIGLFSHLGLDHRSIAPLHVCLLL